MFVVEETFSTHQPSKATILTIRATNHNKLPVEAHSARKVTRREHGAGEDSPCTGAIDIHLNTSKDLIIIATTHVQCITLRGGRERRGYKGWCKAYEGRVSVSVTVCIYAYAFGCVREMHEDRSSTTTAAAQLIRGMLSGGKYSQRCDDGS